MKDFIATEDRQLLEEHDLASFEALWSLNLKLVDEPNTERGGWSNVCLLELGGRAFYLKRQSNHLTRSLLHPLGEPTFAREFRNIQLYQRLQIPALEAAFFAQRKVAGEFCAVLLTRALTDCLDLDSYLSSWSSMPVGQRSAILQACGTLARTLHQAGQIHRCFFPKHIFLREVASGYEAQLIDLEKNRSLWFGWRDRVKDLETLLRRAGVWSEDECREFLQVYLGDQTQLEVWWHRLNARRQKKVDR